MLNSPLPLNHTPSLPDQVPAGILFSSPNDINWSADEAVKLVETNSIASDVIVPLLFNVVFPALIVVAPNVQPPIVPDSATNTPAFVTLNGASANVESPT